MKIIYDGQMSNTTYKETLGETIQRIAEEDADVIYLDADLMSCISTYKWAAQNPDRAINCGVAEANMIGVACGLSAAGYKPIVHTFGAFASRRCFDQVFLSGGYAKNSITIIGTDPGICAAFNGGTHMPFEDIALYRTIPGATVIDITDNAMLVSVLEQCKDMKGVKYLRVGRKKSAGVYEMGSKLPIGESVTLRNGKDAVIFASGIMVHEAMQAAQALSRESIEVTVVDMFTIKPLDTEAVVRYAKETGAVVTGENHNKIGGLYSAVSEALSAEYPVPVEYVAVEDEFGEVGPQDYLRTRYDLTDTHLIKKVKAAIARKNDRLGR